MSLAYRMLYGVGFTPWEQMAQSEPIVQQVSAFFDREQEGREPPYGKVLDLGCGSGIWSVELATRGWQVTGVDIVPKALRRARKRAQKAGVEVRLIKGDVTALRNTGVGSGFRFLLDFGLFQDQLTDAQRTAMGQEVTAVVGAEAEMLVLAWRPGHRRFLPRGASQGDIEEAYPAWTVIDHEALADEPRAPKYVREAEPQFYRLRRD